MLNKTEGDNRVLSQQVFATFHKLRQINPLVVALRFGSNGLNKLAVFKHADYPAATAVEQVKGFARASGFDGDNKGFFGASLAGIVVAVDGGGVLDRGQVEHDSRFGVRLSSAVPESYTMCSHAQPS
jgi:hypothetical protein